MKYTTLPSLTIFKKNLAQLGQILSIKAKNETDAEIIRDAAIHRFEKSWNSCIFLLRQYLSAVGVSIIPMTDPKTILKLAYQGKLIKPNDEQLWLAMLEDAQVSKQLFRIDAVGNAISTYYAALDRLKKSIVSSGRVSTDN